MMIPKVAVFTKPHILIIRFLAARTWNINTVSHMHPIHPQSTTITRMEKYRRRRRRRETKKE
jgi:uncharacterized short protein YbdD (DUF466 family)